MSKTNVVYPIVACLDEACNFLKSREPWNATNEMQTALLEQCYSFDLPDLEKLKDVLDTMSSTDNKALMAFFKERGFEFDIEPFGPNAFGVGSVLNVLVEWLDVHKRHGIQVEDKVYDGVRAKENYMMFSSSKHEHPIVMLETKSDEKIYLTIADKEYEHLELLARVKDINNSRVAKPIGEYDSVIFPMVDLDQDVDISWIKSLNINDADGQNWYVYRAEQKTRFKMNHVGAKAESAVMMALLRCAAVRETKPRLIIDRPFFVWMTRPGLHDPLFVGYIDEKDWKDPGDFHEKK